MLVKCGKIQSALAFFAEGVWNMFVKAKGMNKLYKVVLYMFAAAVFCVGSGTEAAANVADVYGNDVTVWHIADYDQEETFGEIPDDYYLGRVIYNRNNKEIYYEPVKTSEDIALNKFMLWLQHHDEPRVRLSEAQKLLDEQIKIYKEKGISEHIDGDYIAIVPEHDEFADSLRYKLAERWGIIDEDTGSRYFDLGISKAQGMELRRARLYFSPKFPHRKITGQEERKPVR